MPTTLSLPYRAVQSCKSLAIASACAVLLGGCQPTPEAPTKDLILVEAVTAEVSDFASRITLTGEVQADVTTDLAFQTSGQLLERFVDVGDRVEANQELARLSSSEQVADRDAALAALESARFAVAQAETTLDRQSDLLDQGLTTKSSYDAAVEAASIAGSSLDAAVAAYERAMEAIDQTRLRAFVNGTITARHVEAGQVVQAGQPAFTVAADGPRMAVFEVDEGVLTDTFASQNFEVRSSGDPQVTSTGTLQEVSPTIDRSSGTVEITLSLSSTPVEMSLGSVVTTSGPYSNIRAVVVPASALTSDNARPAVWILDPVTHIASRRQIELSVFDNTSLVITRGVEPGELVVTSGANLVFPGQSVRIKQQP